MDISIPKILWQIEKDELEPGSPIVLTGGDPCLYENLPELLDILDQRFPEIWVRTPGPGILRCAKDKTFNRINGFIVMVPSLFRSQFTKITGKDLLSYTIKTLRYLNKTQVPVIIEIPVLPENIPLISDMIEGFLSNLANIEKIVLSFPTPSMLHGLMSKLWDTFVQIAQKGFSVPVILDSGAPPPCTAPSLDSFIQAESLYMEVLHNKEPDERCTTCILAPYCTSSDDWPIKTDFFHPWNPPPKVHCVQPYLNLEVAAFDGTAAACSMDWVRMKTPSIRDVGIMGAFNSFPMQSLRDLMFRNSHEHVCRPFCPRMHTDAFSLQRMESIPYPGINRLLAIAQGRTHMDHPPATMVLNITSFCNIDCRMCMVPGRDQRTELPESVYDELAQLLPHIRRLAFTGGEPLTSRHLIDFIERMKGLHLPYLNAGIITNGTLLTPRIIERIRDSVVDSIVVSVNATRPETYEWITRANTWNVLMKNLEHLAQIKRDAKWPPEFVLSFVILRSNLDQIEEVADLAKRLGAQLQFLTDNRMSLPDISSEESDWFYNDPRACKEAIERISRVAEKMKGWAKKRWVSNTLAIKGVLEFFCGQTKH